MSSEDDAILEAARRTSDILRLNGFSLAAISWEKVTLQGRQGAHVVTPHFPVLEGKKLLISPILQGRIAHEDWGPILAPSMIFYRQLKKGYNIGTLIRFLPAMLFAPGFLVLLFLIPSPSPPLLFGFIAAFILVVSLGVYGVVRLGRSFVLKADKEAALVIGTQSLIEALRKLEHLRELDAAVGNDWPEFGDHPSLTKRIANLQNPPG